MDCNGIAVKLGIKNENNDKNHIQIVETGNKPKRFELRDNEGKEIGLIFDDPKYNRSQTEMRENNYTDTYIISAKSGAWIRQNTNIDRNTEDAVLLPAGTTVFVDSTIILSNENDYSWRKIAYYESNKLKTGYIASEYLISADWNKVQGDHFIVKSPKQPLKLRTGASTDSEIITNLYDGEEVILIPYNSTVSTKEHDWFFIAVKREGKIILGYSAATWYKDGKEIITYLEKKEEKEETITKEEEQQEEQQEKQQEDQQEKQQEEQQKEEQNKIQENNKTQMRVEVDTSSAHGVTLKLREKPTTIESKILAEIPNGTILNTTKEDYEEAVKTTRWLKIKLLTGEEGYVAVNYIKEYKEQTNNDFRPIEAKFGDKVYSGYFGIDITQGEVSPGKLGELLSKNHTYYDTQFNGSSTISQKPSFVYIKIGATGWSNNRFGYATNTTSYYDGAIALARVCEKHGVPFGFYYYSQSNTEKQAEGEAGRVKIFNDRVKNENFKYNVLPFALDIEDGGNKNLGSSAYGYHGRTWHYAQDYGKKAYTGIVNYEMNVIRNITGKDVVIYTDKNVLSEMLNYDELDQINQKNAWIVEVSDAHSKGLKRDHSQVIPNTSNRQMKIDTYVGGVRIDYDFMNKEYFEKELTKDIINNNGNIYNRHADLIER